MLKVTEIFHSLQGESSHAGWPCLLIRLTGCNLRCQYCDTEYAYDQGSEMSLDEIIMECGRYKTRLVEITGGEPLLQKETPTLAGLLMEMGYRVLVETNGTLNIDRLPENTIRIMDIKTPGSGESHKIDWANLKRLRPRDEVKFVITDRKDYEWAASVIRENQLPQICPVFLSPSWGCLPPQDLAQWILDDQLDVRFQLQLHKIIWPQANRGR